MKADGSATELSLVENAMRRDMHPADQFEAFARLHFEEGFGPEEIAARFGVTASVVKQRLKLAAVSPKLMATYRKGELSLDQLMAFALTDDHARQEEVWGSLSWNKGPDVIRRRLTEGQISSRDRRAAFVGLDAYEAAGGVIVRDLFAEDHGGWLADSALLERLVREKLEAAAEELRQEGWKWVDVSVEYPHGAVSAFRRLYPSPVPLPEEEQARLDRLTARYDALAEEHGEDDVPDEVAAEIDALDAEIDSLNQQTWTYAPEDVAIGGVIVSLSSEGALRVERGFVRREDESRQTSKSADGGSDPEAPRSPTGLRPLPDALLTDLTAHRTAALREELAARPSVALLALTHALALSVFDSRNYDPGSCLGLSVELANLGTTPGLEESRAGQAMSTRHQEWARQMPKADGLWDWLLGHDEATRLSLLAYCVARSVDAVQRPNGRRRALAHADRLAEAVDLDMTRWWKPTRELYLGRVSKDRILDAVREGVSEKDARDIAGLKKDAMVTLAERLLSGKGWLPEALRARAAEPSIPATFPNAAE